MSYLQKIEKYRDPSLILKLSKENHISVVREILPRPCNSVLELVAFNTVLKSCSNSICLLVILCVIYGFY